MKRELEPSVVPEVLGSHVFKSDLTKLKIYMLHVENVHNLLISNICHNPFISSLQTVFHHLNCSSLNEVIFILRFHHLICG